MLAWCGRHKWIATTSAVVVVIAAWLGVHAFVGSTPPPPPPPSAFPNNLVPIPVNVAPAKGVTFTLPESTTVASDAPDVGTYLAERLRVATGYAVPATTHGDGTIALKLSGAPAEVGAQGYGMTVTSDGVVIRANSAAGLFSGVQTLLQMLPPAIEGKTKSAGPWTVPGATIVDYPRFAYRGAMLDVARHFFSVAQVERYIDEIAMYKINYLHLHLSDDQGWRIAVDGWPNLTAVGASSSVGGDPGGFYTQADYSAIVKYAASRYVTVVPEIDIPGHVNAALASYATLNCDGKAPKPYTGINVGFSSLCVPLPETYTFIDQVIGQLAALTPGPYIHIGGDESTSTTEADYVAFINKAQQVVAAHGKTVIGWHDVTAAKLLPSTVAEFWDTNPINNQVATATAAGTKVIMAPANHAYLDMKYDDGTSLGQTWAGETEVNTAYDWNPDGYIPGVKDASVLGVEAALWTETIRTSADIDYMAFPRLPAIAEVGWSPWSTHNVASFDKRLATQGPRWAVMGINFYKSSQVPWPADS